MYKYVYLCPKGSDRRYLLENNERRENLIPVADRGQQINLVVNRPAESDVVEIDLRRVFHTMKTKLRIYAWVMLFCFAVGICAPLLLYQFNKKPLTVSSVVTLKYDVLKRNAAGRIISRTPVKDLTAPDGQELDLSQITSSYVLQTALDGLDLSQPVTLAELRDNVRIDRILTEDSRRKQEVVSRMLDDKNNGAYAQIQSIDLTYIHSFVVSLTNGFGRKGYTLTDTEMRLILDRMLSAYNAYLVDTYADLKLPDDEISAIDIHTLDIQETLDLLRTAVQNLYAFCDSKSEEVKAYRSWRTGRSLKDLMIELETVRMVDVDYSYSYVYTNNIVRDRDALTTNYQYQLRNAQTRLDAINENISTNQDILQTYKNDEIFVSMQESDTAKSTKTTTDYYNNLIIEQANNYAKVAELETQISDLKDKLSRLTDASVPASFDPDEATQELASVIDICQRAYAEIRDQFEEIIQSPFFTTYADHSAAQGKTESFLSANAKKVAVGGIAGLIIACGFWFLSGITPEFKLKKDEAAQRKEAEQ